MRFHQLTLANIKNLRGVYHLDFDLRFGSEELFLIFGEMGTGKTSLFDGISLALYGKTPQLQESYSSKKNDSIRYILNTESERCYSSLIFSLSPDRIYRATWFFRNLKKNAKPTEPKRTLERLNSDFEKVKFVIFLLTTFIFSPSYSSRTGKPFLFFKVPFFAKII